MTDPSSAPAPRPRRDADLRASHSDREAVAERLREAAGDGRLDLDELEERLEKAFNAKTYGDLAPLTADLPSGATAAPADPGEPMVIKAGAGDIVQKGHWVVPSRISVTSRLGDIKIDFSEAVCRHSEVSLDINAGVGEVTVIVPHGWTVRSHAMRANIGTVRNKATEPGDPAAPTLEITGRAGLGDVRVRYPNRWELWRRKDN
ncbi:DUF1707 SHOCT-like domain-containing protein [Streptomyces alkaliterrae]|uniref:DUF1707 and DUF2154 domain-containing protein n=1 Tax=Streptomyces alkaliterrae TaxID=2213162 RepID=A0A5P0YS02_9ACTN|nr:DUF1707 domain-containing protein [Streptomyces alkaliterrae]MBB1258820.1 DUF1707 and DUF2154 domain-containing protein [Streptomyces alkaliterrae]MQS03065.1 DUF1707 domain-containing protein [Streptomyces alkaliterrae]